MLLLISPINHEEALESIKGGADIVDVKNPKEGSLGANFPWVIKEIRELTPEDKLVSATLGDVPYKPGTVSLAAMGAHVSGADYIKVGLYGTKNYDEAAKACRLRTKNAFPKCYRLNSKAFCIFYLVFLKSTFGSNHNSNGLRFFTRKSFLKRLYIPV